MADVSHSIRTEPMTAELLIPLLVREPQLLQLLPFFDGYR